MGTSKVHHREVARDIGGKFSECNPQNQVKKEFQGIGRDQL